MPSRTRRVQGKLPQVMPPNQGPAASTSNGRRARQLGLDTKGSASPSPEHQRELGFAKEDLFTSIKSLWVERRMGLQAASRAAQSTQAPPDWSASWLATLVTAIIAATTAEFAGPIFAGVAAIGSLSRAAQGALAVVGQDIAAGTFANAVHDSAQSTIKQHLARRSLKLGFFEGAKKAVNDEGELFERRVRRLAARLEQAPDGLQVIRALDRQVEQVRDAAEGATARRILLEWFDLLAQVDTGSRGTAALERGGVGRSAGERLLQLHPRGVLRLNVDLFYDGRIVGLRSGDLDAPPEAVAMFLPPKSGDRMQQWIDAVNPLDYPAHPFASYEVAERPVHALGLNTLVTGIVTLPRRRGAAPLVEVSRTPGGAVRIHPGSNVDWLEAHAARHHLGTAHQAAEHLVQHLTRSPLWRLLDA